ncbi:hypothetical protein ABIE50_001028 [Chitinophaga sp. OAE865]
MRNPIAGGILVICKKYTASGKSIRWHSTGKLFLHSGKSVIINGKRNGIKFYKETVIHNPEK